MRTPYCHVVAISAALLLIGLALALADVSRPAPAQPLPPRPTLTPAPPTARPDNGHDDGSHQSPLGRITGTVIDLTSGAPAPGIAVAVGDVVVTSDANGNYDRSELSSGSYLVALVLKEGQGTPAQEPILVDLAPGATFIQHLAFYSQQAASPSPMAATTPAPTAQSAAVPTPTVVRPVALPATGQPDRGVHVWVALGLALIVSGAGIGCVMHRWKGSGS